MIQAKLAARQLMPVTLAAKNMKNLIPVITLIVGVGIGWGIATYQSRCAFQEIQKTWTPEFRELVTQSVSIGKTMTKDELQELRKFAIKTGSKKVTDLNSQAYAEAKHALLMKKLIENGEVDEALSYSLSCLGRFIEQYDRGDFENDINEELADKLADHIKSANQCPHSITASGGSE
ncbi:hypothetical protein [Tichowtungia aerotolerans]|uniref:Uncharacterized protein n=1 Tax=Tichowtungia aerotolerans TaxID=2697043 RepID=A0A6P1M255_9BACT|nr:hypothetical protein [Tichowtungia aerotolerans]QHI68670.1 hypothetical protein GT409_04145 [Tichowtungia aerotolerans]